MDDGYTENQPENIGEKEKPFKSRRRIGIKVISSLLVLTFLSREIIFAADPSTFKLQREKEKESKYLPRYLLEKQQKHEDFIQAKEDQESLSRSLEDDFTKRLRKKKPLFDDERRRIGVGGGAGEPLQYTLGDEDEDGRPTTLNLYEYKDGRLEKIVQYDVSGVDVSRYISASRELEGEDGKKFKGGFDDFDKQGLSDGNIVSESYFEGEGENRRVAYVLSAFDDETGKAAQVSLYSYSGEALKEVRTYNIEDLSGEIKDSNVRAGLSEDLLESISVYSGEKGKEKIAYTLGDYDEDKAPTTLAYFEYDGDGKLKETKTYDIEDIKEFVKGSYFNFDDKNLKNILVAEKLKHLSSEELLNLLVGKGLIKDVDHDGDVDQEDANAVLSQLSGQNLLEGLSGSELLTLLFEQGLLAQDAEGTLGLLNFDDVFDALSGEEFLTLLQEKGFLKAGETIASLKQRLSDEGVNLATASKADILAALTGQNAGENLLNGSVASVLSQLTQLNPPSALSASALLAFLLSNGLSKETSLSGLLGALSFGDVFQALSSDELLQALLDEGLIQGASDLASLKALLQSQGIDLAGLTNDQILAALSSASILTESAAAAKTRLEAAFDRDREDFLGVFSNENLLQLLSREGALKGSVQEIASFLSASSFLAGLSAGALLNLLLSNGLSKETYLSGLLGALSFVDVFQALSSDELLQALLDEGLIQGASDLVSLKALLQSQGIDLAGLTNDQILAALSSALVLTEPAAAAKTRLEAAFDRDREDFLGVFSNENLLQLLSREGALKGSVQEIASFLSASSFLAGLSAGALLNLLLSNGLSKETSLSGLLGALSFGDVFQALSSDELLQALLDEGLIQGASDLVSLKALLQSQGIDLAGLTND